MSPKLTLMERMLLPVEVDDFVSQTTERIIEVLDPNHIILAGSFGKSSFLFRDGVLISDFEFVFICDKRWSIKEKKKLLRNINDSTAYDVNLKGYLEKKVYNQILSNYSTKNPGYLSLEYFDTFSDPFTLYSKRGKSELSIELEQTEIPPWESWKLIVNRLADILTLKEKDSESFSEEMKYKLLKLYESFGDAYLIIEGLYVKNISDRLRLIRQLCSENLQLDLSPDCRETFDIILDSMIARESHDLGLFDLKIDHDFLKDLNEWLKWVEFKVFKIQHSNHEARVNCYMGYAKNISFQSSFTELNYKYNNEMSNLIRMIYGFRSLLGKVNLFSLKYNWQHLIFISVVLYFIESQEKSTNFSETRVVLSLFLHEREVTTIANEELLNFIISLWKLLR